eukprot:11428934-Prorocentrum_lima.AAC.1
MTSSLVGSEMCIRDSLRTGCLRPGCLNRLRAWWGEVGSAACPVEGVALPRQRTLVGHPRT